ncbi:hypothetical protein SELMODRAFT_418336 [Selaginella moellendorffii]|uniref:Mitochondrial import inner membrane translocase subunit TIM50 n=2 Tax=Selaginella moellendorffii TaxID=88036 RepID=D8S5E0_SELML|nr:hypothetical protein SELMODRAFT_418336 [Selaginella moellendorffii]
MELDLDGAHAWFWLLGCFLSPLCRKKAKSSTRFPTPPAAHRTKSGPTWGHPGSGVFLWRRRLQMGLVGNLQEGAAALVESWIAWIGLSPRRFPVYKPPHNSKVVFDTGLREEMLDDTLICRKNSTRPGLEAFLSKMAQGFVKDVSKLARCNMKRLVWVDDVRLNFRLCPHNGIEIRPFKGEADDKELEKLTPLLLELSKVEDVTQFLWNGQPKMAEEGKPVLVLDLNETLVWKKDASTIVNRPGLEAFLSRMAMAYSVVIFSVSDSRHLDQSVAGFGASAKLITDVYGIEDCTRTRTGFIKDVRKVKVRHELKRLVWVDNERFHFRLCPHNGIEIKPFRGEADDEELERLTPLLLKLSQVDDVTQFLWNGQPKQEAQEQFTGKNPKTKKKR